MLKNKICQIYRTSKNQAFERAMSRVLTGRPSELVRSIVNDMCPHELVGCCCSRWVYGQWVRNLPTSVRQGIAGMKFSAETFDEICELADDIFENGGPNSARVSAIVPGGQFSNPPPTMVSTTDGDVQYWQQPIPQYPGQFDQEVAAVYYQRGGRIQQGRGRGRGGRGNRGGYQNQARGNSNFNSGNNGQTSGGRGGRGQSRPPYSAANPRHRGTRHPDLPPWDTCKKHFIWGKSAHMCLEPLTCPWASYLAPRPNQQ